MILVECPLKRFGKVFIIIIIIISAMLWVAVYLKKGYEISPSVINRSQKW